MLRNLMLLLFILIVQVTCLHAYYTLTPVKIRVEPKSNSKTICTLGQNISVKILKQGKKWHKVITLSGHSGYVPAKTVSNKWLKVLKKQRRLELMKGKKLIQSYPVALCPFNPLGDKHKEGDGGTPEGRFFICESIKKPKKKKYGSRSMRLSYPNREDARRGLKAGLIKYDKYLQIVKAVNKGVMPSQRTILGSSLRIHGGGAGEDWTLGCVALRDKDIAEVFDQVPTKVRVEVYKSEKQYNEINSPDYIYKLLVKGMKKVLKEKPEYTDYAMEYRGLKYPEGDIKKSHAVCTDVIIRALRTAGIDLQVLLHEDIKLYPGRYKKLISKPDKNIDHRRVRNLKLWFDIYCKVLPTDFEKHSKTFKPGNIVLLDTGIRNGTVYDHIGIVVKEKNSKGVPLVFNIWTKGMKAEIMDLLGSDYPTVVGHYRLLHPFDY